MPGCRAFRSFIKIDRQQRIPLADGLPRLSVRSSRTSTSTDLVSFSNRGSMYDPDCFICIVGQLPLALARSRQEGFPASDMFPLTVGHYCFSARPCLSRLFLLAAPVCLLSCILNFPLPRRFLGLSVIRRERPSRQPR